MGERVAVAGGGLAGPLLAVYLARRGHRVTLYDRRPDPRAAGAEGGRSINLALSTRGIAALEGVGLADAVLADAIPMRGRVLHDRDGRSSFQSYSADGSKAINAVSRRGLNRTLVEAARAQAGVEICFEHRVVDVDISAAEVTVETPEGMRGERHDVVIGSDGAYSAVRDRMVHREGVDYQQSYLSWGYKELSIPPLDGGFALEPNALHIWPRGGSMMIALPNRDKSFTCTLFWPYQGPDGFAGLDSPDAVRARFERDYRDAVPLLGDLVGEFERNPVGALVTVKVWPWVAGRVALLGDAAHAIVPFYGQGMNCAFEDVVELDRCLAETGDDWDAALPRYAARRKPNADAIAELALANFVEMRDRVGSPVFRTFKRVEHAIERALPDRYSSLYELVSFSTVPYAEARQIVSRQRRALAAVAAAPLVAGAAVLAGRNGGRRGR